MLLVVVHVNHSDLFDTTVPFARLFSIEHPCRPGEQYRNVLVDGNINCFQQQNKTFHPIKSSMRLLITLGRLNTQDLM